MLRKILLSVFTVILVGGLVFAFFYFRQMKSPVMDAVKVIPANASLVLRINQFTDLADKLTIGNLFWDEFLPNERIQEIDGKIKFLDSLIRHNSIAWEAFDVNQAYVSFHPVGAEKFDFLLSISLPANVKEADIKELIQKSVPDAVLNTRAFESFNIINVISKESSYSISHLKGVFVLSPSAVLVEDAIRQVNSETSLHNDFAFNKVVATAGSRINANLILNNQNFYSQFTALFNQSGKEILQPFRNFFNTAALDVSIRTNSIMLNGFSFSYDSLPNYLNHIKKQRPQEIEVTRVLPQSTAVLIFHGFSNFSSYYDSYKTSLETKPSENIEKNLLSWVSNELVYVITDEKNNFAKYLVIKSSNIESARESLAQAASELLGKDLKHEEYRDFVIRKLANENIYEKLLGSTYSGIDTTYYTNIGRYFVFGSNIQNVQYFLNEYLAERTLQRDGYYSAFSENLATEANFYIYSNIPRSIDLYLPFLREDLQESLSKNRESIIKFEAVAWQVINNDNLFYNNLYLKFNPQYKEETQSLFETQLENTVSSRPLVLQNHLNNTREIFVQDDENKIYLISNTGKIIWSKKIEDKILSNIYQVDVYKNNKLQILFNTADKIYLLDRNGNFVENYPIALPAQANAGLNIFDYENSKDYRILIACSDNQIYNYSIDGKQVKGFIPVKTVAPVFSPIKHATVAGKDYIIAVDLDGRINIFDRKGESRLKLKERLNISSAHNTFYLDKGRDLSRTYLITTDSIGTVLRLNLNDELEKINFPEISGNHNFIYADIDNDKVSELIFADNEKVVVYDQKSNKLWEYLHENSSLPEVNIFFMEGVKVGFTKKSSEEIFLLDETGTLLPGFPIRGQTAFSIADLNNDRHLNLVTGAGRNIYLYQIK
jgi:hypothetical protein